MIVNELTVYKSIVIFLSKKPSDQILFLKDTPNDVGVLKRIRFQTTSLWLIINSFTYYLNHSLTHGDFDESTEEVEHYLNWVINSSISNFIEDDWTAHGLKKADSWGLARKLAKEIMQRKGWEVNDFSYTVEGLVNCSDVL